MAYVLDTSFVLDRASPVPLRAQITEHLKAAISNGSLQVDDPLPSSRSLASELDVARSTVLASYLELEGEGWVYGVHGSGTFVARIHGTDVTVAPASTTNAYAVASDPPVLYDLVPGFPEPATISASKWNASWRQPPTGLPSPPAGMPVLRQALASYLTSARNLRCSSDEVLICGGTAEALVLLALALNWAGRDIAVEDPGYRPVDRVLHRIGCRCVPVSVEVPDRIPDLLSALDPLPAAVYLTPSHQYPLGHRIAEPDRRAIVQWAKENDVVVVEDDYDSEFRFGIPPVPSMSGLDLASTTIFVGTFSKVLDPGLRLSYIRVPPRFLPQVTQARHDLGSPVPTVTQRAVANLVKSGELSRHITRARRIYGDRRRALLQSLAHAAFVRRLRGIDAGLHIVVELQPGIRAAVVVDQARDRGLDLVDLDDFRIVRNLAQPGLVMNFARNAPKALREAAHELGQCPELRSYTRT